jgi:hypothetical protein
MKRLCILLALTVLVVWGHTVASDDTASAAGVPSLSASAPRSVAAGLVADEDEQTDPHYECGDQTGTCGDPVDGCGVNADCPNCNVCQNEGEHTGCVPELGGYWHGYPDCYCEPLAPPPPDCSHCVWYEGDPIPEGWEVPCGGRGGGYWDFDCDCCPQGSSPIILNLSGNVTLSGRDDGVMFDLFGNNTPERLPWPTSPDEGWLVLDRNGNGAIDNGGELFGNLTLMPDGKRASNGFIALGVLDTNGDGRIDAADEAFGRLKMWRDWNRDGISSADDLVPLSSVGITALSLDYALSRKLDRWGNLFRYRAKVFFGTGHERFAYDVIFASEDAKTGSQVLPAPAARHSGTPGR